MYDDVPRVVTREFTLCLRYGIGFVEVPDLDLAATPGARRLGLTAADFDDLAGRLQQTLEVEMEVFI